jgi:hypothetical protein
MSLQLDICICSQGLEQAFGDTIQSLYTNNASAPLNAQAGLRQVYLFGLYTHCAYVDANLGICGNHTTPSRFQPYGTITSDMLANYSQFSNAIIVNTTFRNDQYLGSSSKAAYYLFLLGTLCAGLAVITLVFNYSERVFGLT